MYKFSLKSGGGGKHICQRILLINEPEAKKYSELCSWILRTFPTRSKSVMPAFYKSLVIPHLDYGSQSLWSPFKVTQINILEKIQHVFTKHIEGIKISPMLKGSKHIESTPIKEKLDRYIIIYIWKKKYQIKLHSTNTV